MNKHSLVIVDLQYDFYNPNGALYVNGAEELPNKIIDYIKNHVDEIYQVIFTLDWHHPSNFSFKHMGGPWPIHCLQYSVGAGIPSEVLKVCEELDIHVEFSKKGFMSTDEYGAFATNNTVIRHNEKIKRNRTKYVLNSHYPIKENEIETYSDKYYVCGLCGDYCVMETIKNLRKNSNFEVKAIPDLIMSIDGGEKFNKYIKETDLKIVTTNLELV